jgi:hypothetical protein
MMPSSPTRRLTRRAAWRSLSYQSAPRSWQRVRVIAGSLALTVDRCTRVLSDRNENAVYGNAFPFIKETTAAGLAVACRQAAGSGRDALVLVDLKDASSRAAITAWERARDQIAEYTAETLSAVLLTTPSQAAMWVRCDRDADQSSGLTELRRFDSVGLRLWLTETTLPFQDEASRAELLRVTGGWPTLVNQVVDTFYAGDRGTAPDPLQQVRASLAVPSNAARLVAACGRRSEGRGV